MNDTNGNAIAIGDTVVFTGVVVALNATAPHFDGVLVNPVYPNSGSTPVGVPGQILAVNNSNTGLANSNAQGPDQRAFDPSQLYDVTSGPGGIYPPIGVSTTAVTAAESPAAIKASAGTLYRVLVTSVGSALLKFYDNASAASGTVLGVVAIAAPIGTIYNFLMPAANGIYCASGTGTPAVTVSWS